MLVHRSNLVVIAVVCLTRGPARADSEACCIEGGECIDVPAFVCMDESGTPQGIGTYCLGDNDDPPNGIDDACEEAETEACCYGDRLCVDVVPAECAGEFEGDSMGPGTACGVDENENGIDDVCEGGLVEARWLGGSGDYRDSAKWDVGAIPCNAGGGTYLATIDVADSDVTIDAASCEVKSLTIAHDTILTVSAAAEYTVLASSEIHGTLQVDTATFESDTSTNIDGADVLVNNGVAQLLGAVSYAHDAAGDGDGRTLAATGTTALLDMVSVTSMTQSPVGGPLDAAVKIHASAGGLIDLGSLVTIAGGATEIMATGTDSRVALSLLTSIMDTNPGTASVIQATQGGQVSLSNLLALDAVNLLFDGTGTMSTPLMTTYTNGLATISGGAADLSAVTNAAASTFEVSAGSLDLSSAVNLTAGRVRVHGLATADLSSASQIDNAGFHAVTGATLAVPVATTYAHHAESDGDEVTFEASGSGGSLGFAVLGGISQTHSGTPAGSALVLRATGGGTLDLGAVGTITGGATEILASGTSSVVDLSALTGLTVTNPGTASSISALAGGSVLIGNVAALTRVDVTIGSDSQVTLSDPFVLTEASLSYGGGNLSPTDVAVVDGGLTLGSEATAAKTFRLLGTSEFAGDVASAQQVLVLGDDHGDATVSVAEGFTNAGQVVVRSDDPGHSSSLLVLNGSLTNLDGGAVSVSPGQGPGVVLGAEMENYGSVSIATVSGAGAELGRSGAAHCNQGLFELVGAFDMPLELIGDSFTNDVGGEIAGHGSIDVRALAFSNDGSISPGTPGSAAGSGTAAAASEIGALEFIGDYSQSASGVMKVEIGGLQGGEDFDSIEVTGQISLAGELEVALVGGFDPPSGTDYEIVAGGSVVGEFDTSTLPELGSPRCLAVTYAPNSVTVVSREIGIEAHPAGQDVCEDDRVTLSVTPVGAGPFEYLWYKNGTVVPVAGAQELVLDPATLADEGSYTVSVSNVCGTVTSDPADLVVRALPRIVEQPTGRAVCEGAPVELSVIATGEEPLRFQWRHDGLDIPNARDAAYSIDWAGSEDAGEYEVLVSNSCAEITSERALLTVIIPLWGDLNRDCATDLDDYAVLAGCLSGPVDAPPSGCTAADLDLSGESVDLADFAVFQGAFGRTPQ